MITLTYGRVYTEYRLSNGGEQKLLDRLLSIRDPKPDDDPSFISGDWDGIHRFCDIDRQRFPTGLLSYVTKNLKLAGTKFDIRNTIPIGPNLKISPDTLGVPDKALYDYQVDTVQLAIWKTRGVIRIGTGGGKTLIQAAIAKALGKRSLLIVQDTRAMHQTAALFRAAGLDVGIIGDKVCETGAMHTIAMRQSLWQGLKRRKPEILGLMKRIVVLQGDEIHHAGAENISRIFSFCRAKYRYGYSGTPMIGRNGSMHHRDMRVIAFTGPLIVNIPSYWLRKEGYLDDPTIYMPRVNGPFVHPARRNYSAIYEDGVVDNQTLNGLGATIADRCVDMGHRVLILVKHIRHGELVLRQLHKRGLNSFFAFGGRRIKHFKPGYQGVEVTGCDKCHRVVPRTERNRRCKCGGWFRKSCADVNTPVTIDDKGTDSCIEKFRLGKYDVMVGITQVFDESQDMPYLSSLINLAGGKSYVSVIQRIGRVTRKGSVLPPVVFDPRVMVHPYLINHGRKRAEEYQQEQYRVHGSVPPEYL